MTSCQAQPDNSERIYIRADSLRGSLLPERACYDVTFYDLNIKVIPEQRMIEGSNSIVYKVNDNFRTLQVDLFKNMKIDRIESQGKTLEYRREYDAVFVDFSDVQKKGSTGEMTVFYHGKPIVANSPPWDGGFVWEKDEKGTDWIAVACEGIGASLWWPNKDHLSDEPDSMRIRCAVPENLVCVSNGNLKKVSNLEDGFRLFDWFVSYPINNYNVSLNIGDYVNIKDTYTALDGDKLDIDYYALSYNATRAKEHFKGNVQEMLACFEQYLGKYPFWRDGYALVETPYLGMEHQSAIAYGNDYQNGYNGRIMAGLEFDNLLVHESGHEYFGNSVSVKDIAELWIHEGFTVYMDALYVECKFGYESALKFYKATQRYIANNEPMVGPLDVNHENDGSDIYYKGAWMLHTLRNVIENDELWFDILRSFYENNQMSNIDSQIFIDHVNRKTGEDFTAFFNQYLYYKRIPELQYKVKKCGKNLEVEYRMKTDVAEFKIPLKIGQKGNYTTIHPTAEWQTTKLKQTKPDEFRVAEELYYINVQEF